MTNDSRSPLFPVREAQKRTVDLISQTLLKAPPPVFDMTKHLAAAQGKGVRTLLLLYAAADGEGLVPRDAMSAAAAVELLHLATLVHDDVIDDAPLRRGIPTVQCAFGRKQAVICGDYLLYLAASFMTPLHADYQEYTTLLSTFSTALGRICLGELKQFRNNRNLDLLVPDYLRIVSGKTAALFYLSALAGAIIARHSHDEAMRLARFGRYLGMVFQIVDDCKDYELSENEAQKTVGKDIAEGVVTLPLIYAMRNLPELRELAKQAFDDAALSKDLARAVCGASGTRSSRGLAARYARKAECILAEFPENKSRPLLELLSKSLGAANIY